MKKKINLIIMDARNQESFTNGGYNRACGLYPIKGKPILSHLLDNFKFKDGVRFHYITTNERVNEITSYFKEHNSDGFWHVYDIEQNSDGPLASFLSASDKLRIDDDAPVIICHSDFFFMHDINAYYDMIRNANCPVISYYEGQQYSITPDISATAILGDIVAENYTTNDLYRTKWAPGVYFFNDYSELLRIAKQQVESGERSKYNKFTFELAVNRYNNFKIFKIDNFYRTDTPRWYEITKLLLESNKN